MPKGCASVAGITADLGAELGKARQGIPRRRLPGSKPGAPMHIRPFEADCWVIRRVMGMNLALRGIEPDFGPEHADTFCCDLHFDLRADPPFSDSDWFRKDHDLRWQSSGARSTAKGSPQGKREGADPSASRPSATPTSPGCSSSSGTLLRIGKASSPDHTKQSLHPETQVTEYANNSTSAHHRTVKRRGGGSAMPRDSDWIGLSGSPGV